MSSTKDVRTYTGACADTDYFMVTATVKQETKREENKPRKIKM